MADIEIANKTESDRTRDLEDRYTEKGRVWLLWWGFLGGFVAWKLHLMVSYMLVPFACWHDLSIVIDIASLALVLIALSSAWVSWGTWKEVGGHPLGEGGYDESTTPVIGRTRFMAISGVIVGAFTALVILGQWIPNLVLSPCHGIH
jgi:uncharacterized membrane protein YfcA